MPSASPLAQYRRGSHILRPGAGPRGSLPFPCSVRGLPRWARSPRSPVSAAWASLGSGLEDGVWLDSGVRASRSISWPLWAGTSLAGGAALAVLVPPGPAPRACTTRCPTAGRAVGPRKAGAGAGAGAAVLQAGASRNSSGGNRAPGVCSAQPLCSGHCGGRVPALPGRAGAGRPGQAGEDLRPAAPCSAEVAASTASRLPLLPCGCKGHRRGCCCIAACSCVDSRHQGTARQVSTGQREQDWAPRATCIQQTARPGRRV